MLCPTLPTHRSVCVVACNTFDQVMQILRTAKAELGDVLQAVEMMDSVSIQILRDIHPDAAYPFGEEHPFYALVEIASSAQDTESDAEDADLDRMYSFIESIEESIIVSTRLTAKYKEFGIFDLSVKRLLKCLRGNQIN